MPAHSSGGERTERWQTRTESQDKQADAEDRDLVHGVQILREPCLGERGLGRNVSLKVPGTLRGNAPQTRQRWHRGRRNL